MNTYDKPILDHKLFSCKVEDAQSVYNGAEIGEGYTNRLKDYLKGSGFKDYGFTLKFIKASPDGGDTLFEITPLTENCKPKEFLNESSGKKEQAVIKFYREGADMFHITMPDGSTLDFDYSKDEIVLHGSLENLKSVCEKASRGNDF